MADNKVKFPLTKGERMEFEDKYEQIFFKRPVHNMKDETLVELVTNNSDKITGNAKTSEQPPQEGIQDKSGEAENAGNAGNADGGEAIIGDGSKGFGSSLNLDVPYERNYQLGRYKELHGEDPDFNLSTEELTAANISKENYINSKDLYFDLFGKYPMPEMTTDQILNLVFLERERLENAKLQNDVVDLVDEDSLKHDSKTQMVIVSKKDKSDKRVINMSTYEFLKQDYDIVVSEPKELKNFNK